MRGFSPILLVIPIAIITLSTILITAVRGNVKFPNSRPISLSRSILRSPSPISSPNSPSPSPSPSSSPESLMQSIVSYLAVPSPSPIPTPAANANVSTGSNYTVVTYSLGSTVITDSANDDDCDNNCPTKSLAQFISDNGGRAGINGTYFCPSDYSWCAGKVNSTDFPIWNNRKKKWMNASKLFWGGRGMMVFRPGSAQFFADAASSGAPSNITGGIVNYPSLLAGGNVVFSDSSLSAGDKLRQKGTRNGIGFGNGKVFLVVGRNVDMNDMVSIFKSLGATDALNTDGGGSSALYDGGYKVGPGRSLPNAVIIK